MMAICPLIRDILPQAFIPSDVDKSVRQLVYDLREERSKRPQQHEDLFQMLLNSVNKYGKNTVILDSLYLFNSISVYFSRGSLCIFDRY